MGTSALSLKAAKMIVGLRADHAAQARLDELADKCKQGELTTAEKEEYENYVSANTLIAILQAKARAVVKRHANNK